MFVNERRMGNCIDFATSSLGHAWASGGGGGGGGEAADSIRVRLMLAQS